MKNIALIGFMGTGKSTIGKKLAKKLQYDFIEIDKEIEKIAGKTIPKIFEEDGEVKFRELEIEAIKKVANKTKTIISCGGGVVLNQINILFLKKNSDIILLEAPAKIIYDRIIKDGPEKRPLLNKQNPYKEIKELLKKRQPLYRISTPFRINTANKNLEQIVQEIIDIINPNSKLHKILKYQSDLINQSMDKIKSILGTPIEKKCFLCKKPLILLEKQQRLECAICHRVKLAVKQCEQGHFICTQCVLNNFQEYLFTLIDNDFTNLPPNITERFNTIRKHPQFRLSGPQFVMAIIFTIFSINEIQKLEKNNKKTIGKELKGKLMEKKQDLVIALQRAAALPPMLHYLYGESEFVISLGILLSIKLKITKNKESNLRLIDEKITKFRDNIKINYPITENELKRILMEIQNIIYN